MEGAKLIERIRLRNILSFGREGLEISLEPLNVLIGPNGSGKSNLIEVLGLLHAAPSDLAVAIRTGGGIGEWIWKGQEQDLFSVAEFGIRIQALDSYESNALDYHLEFPDFDYPFFSVAGESLEGVPHGKSEDSVTYLRRNNQHATISANVAATSHANGHREEFSRDVSESGGLNPRQSALAQIRDSTLYPEITSLSQSLSGIRLYREFNVGRSAPSRLPQRSDLPDDHLLEDASNLGLVLNLMEVRNKKRRIVELLQRFYDPTEDFTIRVQGGTVQFYLHERGLSQPISAMRLSDGTLHFLYLLAILLHPDPPPLICIEEPEIGLHPDVIPTVAELLVEASQRTQLIVTTHSDALVSALSATPEAIVVCERDERGTQLRRLEPERLKEWLDRYTLGDLWHMGEIGGTRW